MSMNNSDYLLTFEFDSKNETLEIHGNQKGLQKLRTLIDSLLLITGDDHIHLMTKNWGGSELSDIKQCQENEIINHVKIFKWTKHDQI